MIVLREVLGFPAAEVAEMLDSSPASVNSALQRARASLESRGGVTRDRAALPTAADERALAGRFAEAFEQGDVDALVATLSDDVLITMPPEPMVYEGVEVCREFLRDRLVGSSRRRKLIMTSANGQPAFAYYLADAQDRVGHCLGVDRDDAAGRSDRRAHPFCRQRLPAGVRAAAHDPDVDPAASEPRPRLLMSAGRGRRSTKRRST